MGELEGSGRGEKRADGLQKGVQEGQRGCQVEEEKREGACLMRDSNLGDSVTLFA